MEVQVLQKQFLQVRSITKDICSLLFEEDMVVQVNADVSPAKWHLGHTTWFFETFVLKVYVQTYKVFKDQFDFIFNSYYKLIGEHIVQGKRHCLSRPLLKEILEYRDVIDNAILYLIQHSTNQEIFSYIELGIHHEQQHQELLYTDIKLNFFSNPMKIAYRNPRNIDKPSNMDISPESDVEYIDFKGGITRIGHDNSTFCFDNECKQHEYHIHDFSLRATCIKNQEYLDFMKDGGYENSEYWFSDAWDLIQQGKLHDPCPLYWHKMDNQWYEFTLEGFIALNLQQPVCHVSFYEASAFAMWYGARLPTEFEWEYAAQSSYATVTPESNVLCSDILHPVVEATNKTLFHLMGNSWEWTSSAYLPYPGFKYRLQSAVSEYNGKFMDNRRVLRGGSCVTPSSHIRSTYRNFLHSHQQWQFTGIRIAKDLV